MHWEVESALVDPLEDLAFVWPPSMIKWFFGSAFLRLATIFMGWIFWLLSLCLLLT